MSMDMDMNADARRGCGCVVVAIAGVSLVIFGFVHFTSYEYKVSCLEEEYRNATTKAEKDAIASRLSELYREQGERERTRDATTEAERKAIRRSINASDDQIVRDAQRRAREDAGGRLEREDKSSH